MKKLLLCMGVAIAAIGCIKDADVDTLSSGNALTITSDIATRAEKSQWVDTDPIGVYMTSVDLGDQGANAKYTTDGSGTFTSDDQLYYPSSGTVSIFAYYPYDSNVDPAAYEITSSEQVDLLTASKSDVNSSYSVVAMTFEHLLSKISLTINTGDGLAQGDLDDLSVKLTGISTTAEINLTDKKVVDGSFGALSEVALTTTDDGTSSSAIIIPQALNGATLSFTTKNYGTFSATLTTQEFEVGNEYSYTATLDRDGVEVVSSNIEVWDNGGEVITTANIVDIEYKSDNKYYINSAKGLAAFRDLVNVNCTNSQNATYAGFDESMFALSNTGIDGVLTRSIDLGEICYEGSSWIPISYTAQEGTAWEEYGYTGTFDGGGHEIRGLYISTTLNQQGLFRYIGTTGVVRNLGLSGGSVTYTLDSNFNGQLGSIAAYNAGTIINCYSSVVVKGEKMCNVGGIAAYSSGSVVNCYNYGDVTGLVNVGGIVGKNDGSAGYVGYCFNTGEVSLSDPTAENGTTTVTIGTGDNNSFTVKYGGVVGYNNSGHDESVKGSFCLNNTYVSIGQAGANTSSGTLNTNVCLDEYLTSETFATTMNNGAATYNSTYGTTEIIACAWVYNANDYPTHDFGTTPTKRDLDIIYNSVSYTINTAMGLRTFAALVNGAAMPVGAKISGYDIYFQFETPHTSIDGKLTDDITVESTTWTPIGSTVANTYSGLFDGGSKTVTGVTAIVSESDDSGMFKYVSDTDNITNITVSSSN